MPAKDNWKLYTWFDYGDKKVDVSDIDESMNLNYKFQVYIDLINYTSPYFHIPREEMIDFTQKNAIIIIVFINSISSEVCTFHNGCVNRFVDVITARKFHKLDKSKVFLIQPM